MLREGGPTNPSTDGSVFSLKRLFEENVGGNDGDAELALLEKILL